MPTSGDDIRVKRALRVIHALEQLQKSKAFDILKELHEKNVNTPLSQEAQTALGKEMREEFCKSKTSHSNKILDAVKSVISDVVIARAGNTFSIQSEEYLQEFKKAVLNVPKNKKPNVKSVYESLKAMKNISEEDFSQLRDSMSFNTANLSVRGLGFLGCQHLAIPYGITEATQETLIIGFDPYTHNPRLDF